MEELAQSSNHSAEPIAFISMEHMYFLIQEKIDCTEKLEKSGKPRVFTFNYAFVAHEEKPHVLALSNTSTTRTPWVLHADLATS